MGHGSGSFNWQEANDESPPKLLTIAAIQAD
jgi:hypothetical protein